MTHCHHHYSKLYFHTGWKQNIVLMTNLTHFQKCFTNQLTTSLSMSKVRDLFSEQWKFHPRSSDKQLSQEGTQTWSWLNTQSPDCQGSPALLRCIIHCKYTHWCATKNFRAKLHPNMKFWFCASENWVSSSETSRKLPLYSSEELGSKRILSCF